MNPYQPGEDNQDPYEVGYKAGAASRDAEVAKLKDDNEYLYVAAIERDQLRAELVKALAACKAKDEALLTCQTGDYSTGHVIHPSFDERLVESALAIQPDDAALKAWLGEPVAEVDDSGVVIVCRYDYKPKDKFYSPKGLK